MRILARTPHNAVVQADETDTGHDYVVTFDVSIRRDEYLIHSYEVSPHDGRGPTQRDIIRLVLLATEFLTNVTKALHS